MKRIILLLFCLLSISISAIAQVITYETKPIILAKSLEDIVYYLQNYEPTSIIRQEIVKTSNDEKIVDKKSVFDFAQKGRNMDFNGVDPVYYAKLMKKKTELQEPVYILLSSTVKPKYSKGIPPIQRHNYGNYYECHYQVQLEEIEENKTKVSFVYKGFTDSFKQEFDKKLASDEYFNLKITKVFVNTLFDQEILKYLEQSSKRDGRHAAPSRGY